MIKIKIDNKEIEIDPKLTIGRYQKIQKNPNKYNNPTEILALYLDLEPKELREMPVDEIVYLESVISQHNQEPNTDIVLTFNFEGVVYGMENDWGNMTWGQWTDLEVFSQKDKLEDNIHILMSLLYRPILEQKGAEYTLEKFDSKKVMARGEIFKNIPIDYWFGASTFFLLLSTTYIKNMESSLKQMNQIKRIILRGMKILPNWMIPKRLHDFILN
jgi:hypothetical protein